MSQTTPTIPNSKRGDVWWTTFDPGAVGGEIRKTRPVIIMSNDVANARLNRIQVVPLTTKIDPVYSGEAIITINGQSRKALVNQLTTISKFRLLNRIGRISAADIVLVENAIRWQLAL